MLTPKRSATPRFAAGEITAAAPLCKWAESSLSIYDSGTMTSPIRPVGVTFALRLVQPAANSASATKPKLPGSGTADAVVRYSIQLVPSGSESAVSKVKASFTFSTRLLTPTELTKTRTNPMSCPTPLSLRK